MTWILIVMWLATGSNYSRGVVMQEFNTADACSTAEATINSYNPAFHAQCVPKGDPTSAILENRKRMQR